MLTTPDSAPAAAGHEQAPAAGYEQAPAAGYEQAPAATGPDGAPAATGHGDALAATGPDGGWDLILTERVRTRARRVSGPTYLYDTTALHHHAAAVRAALPARVDLLYAMKANPEPALLHALRPHVTGFEVASGGELDHLGAALPGTTAAAFGGPGKTDAELAAGLAARVGRFHVESLSELRRLDGLARAAGRVADVLLRVNIPVRVAGAALVMGGAPTPFGVDPADAAAAAHLLPELSGLRFRGIHAHIASGLDAPAAARVAGAVVDWARRYPLPVTEVNVGGGMAVDYGNPGTLFDWPAYGAALARLAAANPDLTIRIEPGRALTAYCGWYATRVLDVKRNGGEWFAIVAGGTHHLRTPAAKGHSQPLTILPGGRTPVTGGEPITVTGQLCTPKDVLARQIPLRPVAPGDVAVFALAGAYAWNISHRDFLMHPPPEIRTIN